MPELKKASPEKTYRQILLDSRKQQLRLTATAVERLRITFDAAVESIRQKIEALPAERIGTPWHRAMLQLTVEITDVMNALKADNATLLDVGMVELAQNAADREAEVARLVEAPIDPKLFPEIEESFPLTNGQSIPVKFGRLALGAVERVSTRYYRDGLKLSDRLHKLDVQGRRVIENVITQGITEQLSARDMAKRLQAAMAEEARDGLPPPRHVTMRIARTEIANAHREAHVMSTEQAPGVLKDYISGVGWRLSLSHSTPDICDVWAAHDEGLGRGVYLPADVPVDHPHGLCFTVSVLKAFPESGIGGKEPDTSKVPQSMVDYYARLGDKPAQAVVSARRLTGNDFESVIARLNSRGVGVQFGSIANGQVINVPTEAQKLDAVRAIDEATDAVGGAGYTVGQTLETFDGKRGNFGSTFQIENDPDSIFEGLNVGVNKIMLNMGSKFRDDALRMFESDAAEMAAGRIPLYNQTSLADTVIHEMGHQLQNGTTKEAQKEFYDYFKSWEGTQESLNTPSIYAQENDRELFAESFVSIVRNRPSRQYEAAKKVEEQVERFKK